VIIVGPAHFREASFHEQFRVRVEHVVETMAVVLFHFVGHIALLYIRSIIRKNAWGEGIYTDAYTYHCIDEYTKGDAVRYRFFLVTGYSDGGDGGGGDGDALNEYNINRIIIFNSTSTYTNVNIIRISVNCSVYVRTTDNNK